MTCGAVSSTCELERAIRLENARQVVSRSGTMDLSTVLTSFEVFEAFEAIVKKLMIYFWYIVYPKSITIDMIPRG